jgi:hypothetical protein
MQFHPGDGKWHLGLLLWVIALYFSIHIMTQEMKFKSNGAYLIPEETENETSGCSKYVLW